MYLARLHIQNETRYLLRQSYADKAVIKSRDLIDLGTDPGRFIVYPGGNSYYYDPRIEEALDKKGISMDDDALDRIFFPFLHPHVQRAISGFDRSYRNWTARKPLLGENAVHDFDKRRYHYLRFGHSSQQYLDRIPLSVFRPLMGKSRDELEQYFQTEENHVAGREKTTYLATIFQLTRMPFNPQSGRALMDQMDDFFLHRLCRLNKDRCYLAGTSDFQGLFPYLVKYVVDYFDGPGPAGVDPMAAIRDFIRRHRIYKPPEKIQLRIKEAEKLFGCSWKILKDMGRSDLSRRYRKAAIRHHPDQGGNPETFRRLTRVYRALLSKKPKG